MAHKITYAIDAAFNFRIGGFATGAYRCNCTVCKENFIGDKRSIQCLGCAIDAVESKLNRTTEQSESLLCPECWSDLVAGLLNKTERWCWACGHEWKK